VKWIIRIGIITVGIPSLAIGLLMLARFRPGRGHIRAEIEINRPAAQVFRWMSREDLIKQWVGGLSEITPESSAGESGEIGKRFRVTEFDKEENARTEMELTVTGYVPGEKLGVQIRSVGNAGEGFVENAEYHLSPVANGTRLRLEVQTDYYGRLPQAFEPMITHAARKKVQRDLDRLKAMVEAEPASAAWNTN
jgi:uncharacterized protein YndB with AHSA1/START domain